MVTLDYVLVFVCGTFLGINKQPHPCQDHKLDLTVKMIKTSIICGLLNNNKMSYSQSSYMDSLHQIILWIPPIPSLRF